MEPFGPEKFFAEPQKPSNLVGGTPWILKLHLTLSRHNLMLFTKHNGPLLPSFQLKSPQKFKNIQKFIFFELCEAIEDGRGTLGGCPRNPRVTGNPG
jgi:hypothetical protein